MSLQDKYKSVLDLGQELEVRDGFVEERDGQLRIGGYAKDQYHKNLLWDEIKRISGGVIPTDLMADIKSGFYVTDLIGAGVNGVTGDYSRGASGFWIENGKPAYPVSEITIAGHLLAMFKSLRAANDLEFRYGVNAPTVRIEGLTIAGR